MARRKQNQSVAAEGRIPGRMMRTLAGGLAVVLTVAAFAGLESAAASVAPASTAAPVSTGDTIAALKSKTTKVTVTKVAATSVATPSGTSVRTTVTVKNQSSVGMPTLHIRLYLSDGDKKFRLGETTVKRLSSGASTTVRATRTAPLTAPAGKYSVIACRGDYEVQKCRTSSASVTVKPARLVTTAASQAFGNVGVGSTSTPRVVTITNRGHAITGTLATSIHGDPGFSVADSTCRASLNPGASCRISVVFVPDTAGTATGSLAVSGKRAAPVSVALSGTGQGAALAISASTHSFDDTVVGSASTPAELVVTNTGNIPTGALDVSLSPARGVEYSITATTCAGMLAPAASCTVGIAFTPTVAGESTATLSVSAAPGGAVTTGLAGTGLAPASLAISPEVIAFGDEVVGGTTDTQTLTVTNTGDVASADLDVTLDGADSEQFTIVDTDCATTLGARASCDVEVAFAPTAPGVASGRLAVSGASEEAAYAALGGVGLTKAHLAISETSYDFGYNSGERVFIVTNDGDTASGEPTVEVDGDSAFAVTSNTCDSLLASGDTCTVGVTYTGSGSTEQSAELSVDATPGGSVSAALIGFPLALTVTPSSHDYEGVVVGDSSDAKSYTLTNHRLTPVLVDGEDVTGSFGVDASCLGVELPAGGTCTFSALFTPTTAGSASGSVVYTAQGATARVDLSGTGLTPAAFSVSASTVSFGAYVPGDTTTREVTVTNTGSQPSTAIGFSITGADAAEFSTGSSDCPTTLPGGASCHVTVGFAPIALGDKNATFTITGATGGTAALSAVAAPTGVSIVPAGYDFGSVAVGGSKSFTFRVVNTTSNPEIVNSVSTATPFGFDFGQDFSCVLTQSRIEPHGSCSVSLAFRPTVAGPYDSRLLTVAGDNFSVASQLSGTGIAALPASSPKAAAAANATLLPTSVTLRDGKPVLGYK